MKNRKSLLILVLVLALSRVLFIADAQAAFPGKTWATRTPGEVAMDGAKLDAAIRKRLAPLQFEDDAIFGSRNDLGVVASPVDFARIGWLWLNEGNWKGQSLIAKKLFTDHIKPGGTYFPAPGESLDQQSRKSPAEVGMDDSFITGVATHATGRWALWRDGYLVHVQGDFNGKQDVASLRKTWHALTVGAAIKQERIPGLDQKMSAWVDGLTGPHADATWWHVITQTSGFDYPYGEYPAFKPGQMWTYSDKNPRVLCNALARVFGKEDFRDSYGDVVKAAYFDAIGMRGWQVVPREDGSRFHLDLEDMGRLGLLVLNRGRWNGVELIPQWFVEQLEHKQTDTICVNYNGPDDGKIDLDPETFPEVPYGFMTWVNTDGDFYPGADKAWAWGAGAGGTRIMWNRNNGIVFAGVGVDNQPSSNGIAHVIERAIRGHNPLTIDSATRPSVASASRTAGIKTRRPTTKDLAIEKQSKMWYNPTSKVQVISCPSLMLVDV